MKQSVLTQILFARVSADTESSEWPQIIGTAEDAFADALAELESIRDAASGEKRIGAVECLYAMRAKARQYGIKLENE